MTVEQYYRLVMAFNGDEGRVRRFFPRSCAAMLRTRRVEPCTRD